MNTLRFDRMYGHEEKKNMRQNAYLQKKSVIFSQEIMFFPLLEQWNDT